MAPSLLHLALALDCFGGILYLLFAPHIPRAFLPWLTAGIIALHLVVAGILYWQYRSIICCGILLAKKEITLSLA